MLVATGPRQVVQMDTIMFREPFAFMAIDINIREADIMVAPALTAASGCEFLEQALARRLDGWVQLIQKDGGNEFKEAFSGGCWTTASGTGSPVPTRRTSRPNIESFNRTVRKECLGWLHYRRKDLSECRQHSEELLHRYHHHRSHLSLGLDPPLRRGGQPLSDIFG